MWISFFTIVGFVSRPETEPGGNVGVKFIEFSAHGNGGLNGSPAAEEFFPFAGGHAVEFYPAAADVDRAYCAALDQLDDVSLRAIQLGGDFIERKNRARAVEKEAA